MDVPAMQSLAFVMSSFSLIRLHASIIVFLHFSLFFKSILSKKNFVVDSIYIFNIIIL